VLAAALALVLLERRSAEAVRWQQLELLPLGEVGSEERRSSVALMGSVGVVGLAGGGVLGEHGEDGMPGHRNGGRGIVSSR
jgi:hypothetical protein